MKEKMIYKYKFTILFSISIFINGCSYMKFSVDRTVSSNREVLKKNYDKTNAKRKETVIINKIFYNTNCNCGLLDVKKNTSTSFSPFLLNTDNSVINFTDQSGAFYNDSLKDSKVKQFIIEHRELLTDEEFLLIKERFKFDKIQFRGSLINSDLDIERDSLLLEKFLNQDKVSIKLKR